MKFNEYKYERPDYDKVKELFLTLISQINNAKGYEEQNKYIKELNDVRKNIETMSTLASIRNSINTADEFYDKEQNYWDEYGPLYTKLNADFYKAIVNSKFISGIDLICNVSQWLFHTIRNNNCTRP